MRSPAPWNGATECSSQLGKTTMSPGTGASEWRVFWVELGHVGARPRIEEGDLAVVAVLYQRGGRGAT